MPRTYIELHAIQTVPPSNINRDDTGAPKTAIFGGSRRARVSSQAWKRAIRREFPSYLAPSSLGSRTKRIVELVANAISDLAPERREEAIDLATKTLKAAGFKIDKPKKAAKPASSNAEEVDTPIPESAYLVFLSNQQIDNLAHLALETDGEPDKKVARDAANTDHSVDLALFGRMVADTTNLNVDATAQVAHAISVHSVENEFDFYTAVDDFKEDSEDEDKDAGAGMIGTVEFNSSTLYRYATVSAHGLHKALGDHASTLGAIDAFVRAFATSMPSGKQNTFANRTLPDALIVTVRQDQPINFANAFERAVVETTRSGRLARAASKLLDYSNELDRAYGPNGKIESFVVRVGEATEQLNSLGTEGSLDELIAGLRSIVSERIDTP